MNRRHFVTKAAPPLVALLLQACARAEEPALVDRLRLPSQDAFPRVADALERRCATLDCHGKSERPLRIYSGAGLRLAPSDVPGSGATTSAEYEATYGSFVGLEPEIMSLVVAEGGDQPERLTLLRKARGSESHKGGDVITEGDASDRCLRAWLASVDDEGACEDATNVVPPHK